MKPLHTLIPKKKKKEECRVDGYAHSPYCPFNEVLSVTQTEKLTYQGVAGTPLGSGMQATLTTHTCTPPC